MQPRTAPNDWYYRKIRDFLILPKDEETLLMQKAKEGNKKARDKLVEHNLRLVMSQANKIYYGMGLSRKSAKFDLIDLIAEGNLGLFTAIDNFDEGYGTSFTTLAVHWIQQKIRRFIQDNKSSVRVPIHLQDFINKYKGLHKEFMDEVGRPPTSKEAAMALQVSESKIESMDYADFTETSLNRPVTEDGSELQDILACADPDLRYNEGKLDMVVSLLDRREGDVIKQRVRGDTLQQIGQHHNLSRERIRQIEKKAIEHIKRRAIQVKRGIIIISGSEDQRLQAFKETLQEVWAPVR